MYHKITIRLNLLNLSDCEVIKTLLHPYKIKAFTINPDTPQQERSFIQIEKCFHDEHPHQACINLYGWDSIAPPP